MTWTSPTHLDGARVLFAASGCFGMAIEERGPDDRQATKIVHLAIAQYEEAPQLTYLFACDSNWKVVGDLAYDSVEEAQRDAERHSVVAPIQWQAAVG